MREAADQIDAKETIAEQCLPARGKNLGEVACGRGGMFVGSGVSRHHGGRLSPMSLPREGARCVSAVATVLPVEPQCQC